MAKRMRKIERKTGTPSVMALLAQAFEIENGKPPTKEDLDDALHNLRWLAKPRRPFREIFEEVFGSAGNLEEGNHDTAA